MEYKAAKRRFAFGRTIYMFSARLKGLFFVLILASVLGIILYTQNLVDDLRKDASNIVQFYAETLQRVASEELAPEALEWFFVNLIQRTNFPLILTDIDGNPVSWKDIKVPENDTSPEAYEKVRDIMKKMARENKPVTITHGETIINYLYYGDSKLITRLSYLPYVTISGLGLIILAAFFGFSSIKRSEQRFIWVGMAKETAHQLGTPISSLLGWLEMIKSNANDPDKIRAIANDIESDVKRLEKVAARFSQIGSEADLKTTEIHPILHDVVEYFNRRLPQSGREIKIIERYGEVPPIPINRDLFEWAMENLIKNGLDAVKQEQGVIEIETGILPENGRVYIDIKDNGTGITAKHRNDIFKAGYSTKKRGWGLGLNFTKRIIEEYHRGRLIIKETRPGKGTTMRIIF